MRLLICLSPILLFLSVSIALADLPTADELQQLFKQGDYAGVIKGATDQLTPGGMTDAGDRFKVALLRAEAQMRLRQADAAADAFTAAAKETPDDTQAAIANATVILIGRSKDFIYTSVTIKPPPSASPPQNVPTAKPPVTADPATTKPGAKPKPVILPRGQFDIIDPVHRADALQALWTDERTDAVNTIKEKIAAKTLPALNEALDRIHAAEPIAIAAGFSDWPQTQKNMLANAARLDANAAMKDMNTQLIEITKDQAKRLSKPKPKPMPQTQRDQLNQMSEALIQITEALKAMPEALNVDKDEFQSQLDRAADLEDKATTVLATD